jgi:hypothetical protein
MSKPYDAQVVHNQIRQLLAARRTAEPNSLCLRTRITVETCALFPTRRSRLLRIPNGRRVVTLPSGHPDAEGGEAPVPLRSRLNHKQYSVLRAERGTGANISQPHKCEQVGAVLEGASLFQPSASAKFPCRAG